MGAEAGYLYEVPLLALVIVVVAAVLDPRLPRAWNLLAVGVAAAAVIGFLAYNFFFPGWRPRRRR